MIARREMIAWLFCFASAVTFVCTAYASDVKVEDIQAKKVPGACRVFGKVRNLENHAIKGYVKIKFLDGNGDILKTANTDVNGLDPIKPGQAGPFEYYTEPENCFGVVSFQVLFRDM